MEFGFSLPSRGQAATMQNMRLLAQHVEALGLDSVWVSDHIIVPRHIDSFYPYDSEGSFPSAPDQDYYEPLTTLAFLAACTTRVQLGTSVLILPYRNALLTAKMVSTLDALSRLRDGASHVGRNLQDITISFRAPLAFANDGGASRQPLTGSPAAIQDDIGRYADCGVSHMVFDIMTADVAEMQRVMERF